MKVMIEVEVPDEYVRTRVEAFNNTVRGGEWGEDAKEATPESYLREVVGGLCEDEIPTALFSWPVTARVVSVE